MVLACPTLRVVLVIIAVLKATPRREPLKECTHTHVEDILAVELVSVDMEMMSTSIQILFEFIRNVYRRDIVNLVDMTSFLIGPVIERLARSIVHHQAHVDKEIKAHL